MRYFLQFALSDNVVLEETPFTPDWIQETLPIKNSGKIANITWSTFSYETNDKSIVEANWEQPFYYNNEYFIFIGGHIYYRIIEADIRGKYVPTPEEVLNVLLVSYENHYDVLKGNYHIVLYNRLNKSAKVFTSPLSLYPAWYVIQDGVLHVSNLLESLIRSKKELSINPQGLVEFSLFDHCLGSNTIYSGVFQLNGGYILSISNIDKTEELVYDINKWFTRNPIKRKDSIKFINTILKRHISEYVNSVKKLNISLTGGFDGRLNFSFINKSEYYKIKAFSYGMKESLQLKIPKIISEKLLFQYKEILLDEEFEQVYADLGLNAIKFSGGITPFIRANYPYAYGKVNTFSHNCILGQCDMIRPLYTNPAGAIFNNFSHELFYNEDPSIFYNSCSKLSKSGFLEESIFTKEIINNIYNFVRDTYILPYPELNNNERYYFFLMKESMVKFWQTECHVVDLFVNDFISFSDLDYIETLSKSEYYGLYKGIFASNQIKRRKGQDLYADLMYLNNNMLNEIIVDRFYKPKWIRKSLFGYIMIAIGKWKVNQRNKKIGNDTFAGQKWSERFYIKHKKEISKNVPYFNLQNLQNNKPYVDNNTFRYDRHISLKLWLQYLGILN